ncbi:TPA: DUF1642 domain-containing protein [Streptococcus pyogenes]|nr:DUF1642 domain-containing protein [Streptococcus pyogenes]HER0886540.1 DUF1642 domain-containing protein [Streptococcus pyogenes]HER0889956.1 DUF1642 domain-containing protein [Streptococcus pyogenes]HER0893324.1 DUF1642 domain-containing protein [Streptococcus pyogenes]
MNIEEAKRAIRELEAFNYFDFKGNLIGRIDVLGIIDQLDQPKPEIPKFVAEWYEEHKNDLEYNLYLYQMSIYDGKVEKDDFYYWMQKSNNPVRTFINMHQFGYTVKEEKLYTVEIPNPNYNENVVILSRNLSGYINIVIANNVGWRDKKANQLTESEIRKDFEWAWQWAEEVRE